MLLISFQLIDHQRVVVDGTEVLNKAINAGELSVPREYLASLQFTPERSVVEFRLNRISKLKTLNASDEIVEMEQKALDLMTGVSYQNERLQQDNYEQLREKLVGLFIPWSETECYFDDYESDKIKNYFSKSKLPVDANNEIMIPGVRNLATTSQGYLSPDDVDRLNPLAVELLNAADPQTDFSYSEFFERASSSFYGVYYKIEFETDS